MMTSIGRSGRDVGVDLLILDMIESIQDRMKVEDRCVAAR